MLVTVTVTKARAANAVVVPRSAVAQTPSGSNVVYIVADNKAQAVPVRVGVQTDTLAQVISPRIAAGNDGGNDPAGRAQRRKRRCREQWERAAGRERHGALRMTRSKLSARAFAAALALGALVTTVAHAQSAPSPAGQVPGVQMPSPMPQPTISGTPLPYPAYGTPAPDVEQLTPKKGVPQSISLADAIRIGVALSPTFASQNAAVGSDPREIHLGETSALSGDQRQRPSGQQLYQRNDRSTVEQPDAARRGSAPSPAGGVRPTKPPFGVYSRARSRPSAATISITQLIYDGGRTIAAIRSAKEADIAGRATLLRQLQTLALNIANAYYAVLENNATVTADAQLVHEFEVNEASVAAQIRNGAAARSDIAAAQFQTAQARGNLVTAQGTAIGAQATFATTLGLDADAMVVPHPLTGQPAAPNPSYAASLKRALIMRPDYIAAAYNVQSDQENLRFAKLARFPMLAAAASDGVSRTFINCLSTTGGNKGDVTSGLGVPGTAGWSNDKALGLNLTIPIYDQGLTNYNVAQSPPRSSIRRSRRST